jgi:hypothetical protein
MKTVIIRVDMGTVASVRDAAEFAQRFICTAAQEHGYNAVVIKAEDSFEVAKASGK